MDDDDRDLSSLKSRLDQLKSLKDDGDDNPSGEEAGEPIKEAPSFSRSTSKTTSTPPSADDGDPLDDEKKDPIEEEDEDSSFAKATADKEGQGAKGAEEPEDTEAEVADEEEKPTPKETFTKPSMPVTSSSVSNVEDQESEHPDQPPIESSNLTTPSTDHNLDDLASKSQNEDLDSPLPIGVTPQPSRQFYSQSQSSMDIPHVSNLSPRQAANPNFPRGSFNNSRFHGLDEDKGSKKWQYLCLGLIGLAVIGGTVFFLKGNFSLGGFGFGSTDATPSPSSITQATPEPTPTPTPELDRSAFTVKVLNGTPKSGFAASTSAKLEGLGYKMEKPANATNSAFKKTVVRVKESATGLLEQLIKDLAPDFEASSAGTLKDTDAIDGEVILGAS